MKTKTGGGGPRDNSVFWGDENFFYYVNVTGLNFSRAGGIRITRTLSPRSAHVDINVLNALFNGFTLKLLIFLSLSFHSFHADFTPPVPKLTMMERSWEI